MWFQRELKTVKDQASVLHMHGAYLEEQSMLLESYDLSRTHFVILLIVLQNPRAPIRGDLKSCMPYILWRFAIGVAVSARVRSLLETFTNLTFANLAVVSSVIWFTHISWIKISIQIHQLIHLERNMWRINQVRLSLPCTTNITCKRITLVRSAISKSLRCSRSWKFVDQELKDSTSTIAETGATGKFFI
jgi:hypothetical protein